MPTIGFNVETVQWGNLRFQVWDLGGQTSIRPYWRCYYQNTNAVIYVVDSADPDRIGISKQELYAASPRTHGCCCGGGCSCCSCCACCCCCSAFGWLLLGFWLAAQMRGG